jgi:hypothetical protein
MLYLPDRGTRRKAFGIGHVKLLKLLLPPGSIVGMGFSEIYLLHPPSRPFKYLPREVIFEDVDVGDDVNDGENYVEDREDDYYETDSDPEHADYGFRDLVTF